LSVWLWWAVPNAGSSTLSFDTSGTQNSAGWFASEWTGADTSSPIVQFKCANGSSTAIAATFDSAYASSNNRPYAWARTHIVAGTLTEEAGWTDMPNSYNNGGTENGVYAGIWRNDTSDTSPSLTGSASAIWSIGAIEIKAASSGSGICMGCGMSSGGFMN
jgi:hypothetical protein